MRIDGIIWLPDILDKLQWKHHVLPNEVGEVLLNKPKIRKVQKGHISCEHLYSALGNSESGRKLIVFFSTNKRKKP